MGSELVARALATVLGALAVCACASVPRDAGFAEVAALARERGGHELAWRRGGPEDEELDRRVRALASEELTLESAVEIALLSNRRLQALYAELGFAQADLLAAARLPNPLLHAELRFPEGGGRSALDLGLEQSFLTLLRKPLKKRMAADAFEAAKLRVTAGALALSSEVRAAFRRLQGEQQLVELARTSLEAAEASYELAGRLHAAGNIRDLDLALERAQREEARVAVADAELALTEQREALATLLGLYGGEAALRVSARLPDLPSEVGSSAELEARAIASSLSLDATRHEIERAGRRLDLAGHQGLVPDLALGVVAERESEGHWELGPSLAQPLELGLESRGAGRSHARALLDLPHGRPLIPPPCSPSRDARSSPPAPASSAAARCSRAPRTPRARSRPAPRCRPAFPTSTIAPWSRPTARRCRGSSSMMARAAASRSTTSWPSP